MIPAKRSWRFPRQAAGSYAGYADISERLESCFLRPQSSGEQVVCVLSGMGGVGKSESVLQFLKKHDNALRERYLWSSRALHVRLLTVFYVLGCILGRLQ